MNFFEALTEVRRKLGFIFPNSGADIEWVCREVVNGNRGVFDALAES